MYLNNELLMMNRRYSAGQRIERTEKVLANKKSPEGLE